MSEYASLGFVLSVGEIGLDGSVRGIYRFVDREERTNDFRVEFDAGPIDQKLFRVGRFHRRPPRAVDGYRRVRIGEPEYPGGERDLNSFDRVGITAAVPPF